MAATSDIECQSYHDDKMEDEDYVLQVLLKENQRQTSTPSFTNTSNNSDNLGKLLRLVQIFMAKLVLEVFGGSGAIWGFSEVVGFRTASTIWFWKPSALAVGAIFFMRWLSQIQEYIVEEKIIFFERKTANGVDTDEEKIILTPQKLYS